MDASSPPLDADTRYYRDVLHELIDMGTQLARAVHAHAMRTALAQAKAPLPDSDAPAPPDSTVAFDRIARTVRRTVLMARHIAEPPKAANTAGPRDAARRRILRECEDKIAVAAFNHRNTPGRIDSGALRTELRERLDAPDLAEALADDIQARPIAEIIAEICRDLGLGFDDVPGCSTRLRRTPADVALLIAQAAAPPRAAPSQPPGPSIRPKMPSPGMPPPGPALANALA